ncbi:MAG: Asp-tRNA(Asn)/Glu-tRNA(Gln) amidotransferase subunit GatB [Desulfovibrio sp.]|nr:Asp-tRNA(Asn)/Glu-tRNA(Gln) amidotransferase subunit GatB [Desulfovibrio sp.]
MRKYEAVIGLEVHVRLATKSKLFCSCPNQFGDGPNENVCEICSGMPGALPSPNAEAIRLAATAGLAANCRINQVSRFARKNYFYPDLPSGYQISQFDLPICEAGYLEIQTSDGSKKIGVTRIHMENDAGKNIHSTERNLSFVDLNRAGSPLIEIVSEPDLRSAEEAELYLKKLHGIVVYLGISDGNMEEGSFRCDANVSLRPAGSTSLGTRTELKNLNSFRNVRRAIEYEIERQSEELDDGRAIVQETRLYDADKNLTRSMRDKEEAEDYRYFPDPDLLPLRIEDDVLEKWRASMPEDRDVRLKKFMSLTGLPEPECEILTKDRFMADFFETAAGLSDAKICASLIIGPVARYHNNKDQPMTASDWEFTPQSLAKLANLIKSGRIASKTAQDILPEIFESGEDPEKYVERKGLIQISDTDAIEQAVAEVLAANPKEVEAYRGGKKKLVSFFVGQIMRATKGKGNPAIINKLLLEKLEG